MDEKKVYSIIGKVEIGTDEYRDLIEAVHSVDKEKSYWYNRWSEENNKVTKLGEENKKLREELEKYKAYIKKSTVTISDENLSIFMDVFGED